MWIAITIVGIMALAVIIILVATSIKRKKVSPNQNLLTELDSLKDKGLITEQEYTEKRTAERPDNRIISRKFVEIVIVILFVLSLLFTFYLTLRA
jgi:hypothetical protein